jgi:type IV pilus assembly protein PilM
MAINLKQIVEKFFTDTPSKVIGIDIGSGNVKMVQIDFSGKKPLVTNMVSAELPADLLNNGYIRLTDVMIGFLKKLLDKGGFSAKHVVFAIGGRNAFVREIEVPKMPDEEMRQSAIWDAGKYVPYEANSYYTDAAKFGDPGVEGLQPMLLVAAPKDLVDTMLEISDTLQLKPVCIDIEVLACYRVMAKQEENFVLLDIGRGYSLITIFQGGAPVAQRSIPQGSQMFDSAIADSQGCNLAEAEKIKIEQNILDSEVEVIREKYKALFEAVDNIDREVHRTCEYYKMNKKDAVFGEVVLTGGGSSLLGLEKYLNQAGDTAYRVLDLFERVNFSERLSKKTVRELANSCAVAIGSALAGGGKDA